MPELPEVETTRRALAPALAGKRIRDLVVREPRLRRWCAQHGITSTAELTNGAHR